MAVSNFIDSTNSIIKSNDGFTITNRLLVEKLLTPHAPRYEDMVFHIRHEYGFPKMNPHDVIATFL